MVAMFFFQKEFTIFLEDFEKTNGKANSFLKWLAKLKIKLLFL